MTNADLREVALAMRRDAVKVGTLSGLWDVIFDVEALVAGKPTLATRAEIERMASDYIARAKA